MIRQFFGVEDVKTLDFVPYSKLNGFAQDLNRILMSKIAGDDETKWNAFLDQYQLTTNVSEQTTAEKSFFRKHTKSNTEHEKRSN